MVSNGCHPFLSTYQFTPSRTPASACSPPVSRQRQHNTRNERSRTPESRTVEGEDCMALLTSNTHTLSPPPSKTHQPSPDKRDEQMQLEALLLPAVPTVDNKGHPSSTTPNSYLTPFPITPTSSPSTLSGPAPPSQIDENHPGEVFTSLTGNETAQYLGCSTSIHVSDAREPGNLKDEARVVEIDEQVAKEMEVAEEVTMMPLITVPTRTLYPSVTVWSMSTTSYRQSITSSDDLSFSPIHLPTYSGGRTCSQCAQSQLIDNFGYGYSLPDNNNHTVNCSNPGPFIDSTSSLPMPCANENEDDPNSDPVDLKLGLVMNRSAMNSIALLEPY